MRRRILTIVAAGLIGFFVAWLALRPPVAPEASTLGSDERRGDAAPPPMLAAPAEEEGGARRPGSVHDGEGDSKDGTRSPEKPADVSLRIVTVDAADGVPLPSTWNLGDGSYVLRTSRGHSVQLLDLVKWWEAGFLPSGAVRPDAFGESSRWTFGSEHTVTVRPPTGYLAPEPRMAVTGALAAGVREAVVVVPVHREAPLHLRVLGPGDRPAVGATVSAVEAAGSRLTVAVEDLGHGEFLVRGIPHLAGEPVAIAIDWSGDVPAATEGVERTIRESELTESIQRPDVTGVIPADLSRPWIVVVRLAGPTEDRAMHTETDNDLPVEDALVVDHFEGPVGTVRVRVLGWDGVPVPGATVRGRVADADGVALLTGLAPGEHTFRTRPKGRFAATATGVVREGAEVEVVLREPVGATLDVLVTDEEGNPRPSALLSVGGAQVFDVADGVQRLDRYTDARGRRTFARVEPGQVTLHAAWGSRHGSETVTLRDGDRTSVRITAK